MQRHACGRVTVIAAHSPRAGCPCAGLLASGLLAGARRSFWHVFCQTPRVAAEQRMHLTVNSHKNARPVLKNNFSSLSMGKPWCNAFLSSVSTEDWKRGVCVWGGGPASVRGHPGPPGAGGRLHAPRCAGPRTAVSGWCRRAHTRSRARLCAPPAPEPVKSAPCAAFPLTFCCEHFLL